MLGGKMKKLIILFILINFLSCDMILDQLGNLERKKSDTLVARERMKPGDKLISPNKKFEFEFQTDSNLVLNSLDENRIYWSSDTAGTDAIYLVVNFQGTLKLRSKENAIWIAPGSEDSKADKLVIHNDGSLILFKDKEIIWSVYHETEPTEPGLEVHFVSEKNYFQKTITGGESFIEIEGYPPGVKAGDIVIISVLSNKELQTPIGYELYKSGSFNELIPSYISESVNGDLLFTQYYSIAIVPNGGACIVGEADILFAYMTAVRTVVK